MDYERKYKLALDRAKECLQDGTITTIARDYILEIFPEFQESKDEDERIRKGLIKAVSGILKGNTLYGTNVTREEALAWLEKQGKNKKIDADKIIGWLVANILDYEYYVKWFKKDFKL